MSVHATSDFPRKLLCRSLSCLAKPSRYFLSTRRARSRASIVSPVHIEHCAATAAAVVIVVVISIPSIPLSAPLVSEVSSSLSVSHSELNQSRKLVGGWHGCSYNLMRSGGPSYLAMSRSLTKPLALPRDHPLQSLQGFSSSLDNGYNILITQFVSQANTLRLMLD